MDNSKVEAEGQEERRRRTEEEKWRMRKMMGEGGESRVECDDEEGRGNGDKVGQKEWSKNFKKKVEEEKRGKRENNTEL